MEAVNAAEQSLMGDASPEGAPSVATHLQPHLHKFFSADRKVVVKVVIRFAFECGGGSPQEELRPLILQKWVGEEIYEDLVRWALGWVKRETDFLLEKGLPARIDQKEFHDAAVNFVRAHDRTDILRSFAGTIPDDQIKAEIGIRNYVRQLGLIAIDDDEIYGAINDFMKAAVDRTVWSERGMISETALDDYSDELFKSWKNKRDRVVIGYDNKALVSQGRLIYRDCIEHTVPLDGLGTPPYFTRGSWHTLADDEIVGWHPNYKDELRRNDGEKATAPGENP